MFVFDAICRGRNYFWKSLLFFDAWSWRYLSWPDIHLEVIAFLWCLILMVYVVFQSTWLFYCLLWMLDFDAICGVPEHLAILLLAFDAWFWCYLSCSTHFWRSLLFFDAWSWRYLTCSTHFWRSLLGEHFEDAHLIRNYSIKCWPFHERLRFLHEKTLHRL